MMRFVARLAGVCVVAHALLAGGAHAQGADPAVLGLYHWVHSSGDAERAFAFYHDVLGIELARSPFAGPPPANAPPPQIQPAGSAGSDPLVWDLTDTKGSRFRTVFMRAPNTPFGLELSEFFDVPRSDRRANAWDPGASVIEFAVRNLDAVLAAAKSRGASVVSVGGAPITVPDGRAVVVRDPDGYLLRFVQASRAMIAAATPAEVVSTAIGITVADTRKSVAFYRDLLGLEVQEPRRGAYSDLQSYGLEGGELIETVVVIPGTRLFFVLLEFGVPKNAPPSVPFHWRLQDVGSPQMQLQVSGLDTLIARTQAAGYRFLSVGARPIQRPFGRFVFAIGPDSELVEFVEPAARD